MAQIEIFNTGDGLTPENFTNEVVRELFLSQKDVSKGTTNNYRSGINQFFKFLNKESLMWYEIQEPVLKGFRDSIKKATTANSYMKPVLGMYQWLYEENILKTNVGFNVKARKTKGSLYKMPLTDEQVNKVLDYLVAKVENAKSEHKLEIALRNLCIMYTAFITGARSKAFRTAEIEGLGEIDGIPVMHHKTKGKYSKKYSVLTPTALKWIKKYLSLRKDDSKYLFAGNAKDGSLSARFISDLARKTFIAVKIIDKDNKNQYTFHSIRHTVGCLLYKLKGIVFTAMWLGHSKISTSELYALFAKMQAKWNLDLRLGDEYGF